MNRDLWIRRGAGLVVLICTVLCVTSAGSAITDLNAVAGAAPTAPPASSPPARPTVGWNAPKPVLRAPASRTEAALNEYLNGRLAALGLTLGSIDIADPKPLGDGLVLMEVQVSGRGGAAALLTLAQWVAVNRGSIRLKATTAGLNADGDSVFNAVLLVVVA